MVITKPEYFDRFQCLASRCPDSCCQQWQVSVDPESAESYLALPGPLGQRLRQVLRQTEEGWVMELDQGRCPMWRQDGLCRIQAELGHQGLSQVCQQFPRLTHDYGDFVELGLELSCPEAAKYILQPVPAAFVTERRPGGQGDYDWEAMALLLESRANALALLSPETGPVGQQLGLLLLYGCQVQCALDEGELPPWDTEAAKETLADMAKPGDMGQILSFFADLDILTPQWARMLQSPAPTGWVPGHLALARYLVQRYWLQAVSDYDLYSRVKFILVSCLLVRHLGGDLIETAQRYSKEIENSWDNLDAILDAAYRHPAFTDDKLLGLLK